MSVLAGFSTLSSVILLSDCRATIQRPGAIDTRADCVQKLFALDESTAIGFVGDIQVAGELLRPILTTPGCWPRREDPVTLLDWLPRFMRRAYRQIPRRLTGRYVSFMVGSVIHGRPNIVERRRAVSLFNTIRESLKKTPGQNSWTTGLVLNVLTAPPGSDLVAIPYQSQSLLFLTDEVIATLRRM